MPSGNGQPGDVTGPYTESDGRTYYMVGGAKNYVSPAAMHQQTPGQDGNFFQHNSEWNQNSGEYDKNIDWGNILSLAAGGMLGAGALSAGGVIGGGAEATGVGATGTGAASVAAPTTAATTGAVSSAGAPGIMSSILGKGGLSALSTVLGSAARAGSQANQVQDSQNIQYENAKLNRDKYALEAPGARAKQSIMASIAGNFTPSTLDWGPQGFHPGGVAHGSGLPTVKGGGVAGMQNLDPSTKALLQQLITSNLKNNTNNQDDTMSVPPPGGESAGNKALGAAGIGTSLLSMIAPSILGRARGTAPSVPGTPGLQWDDMMDG